MGSDDYVATEDQVGSAENEDDMKFMMEDDRMMYGKDDMRDKCQEPIFLDPKTTWCQEDLTSKIGSPSSAPPKTINVDRVSGDDMVPEVGTVSTPTRDGVSRVDGMKMPTTLYELWDKIDPINDTRLVMVANKLNMWMEDVPGDVVTPEEHMAKLSRRRFHINKTSNCPYFFIPSLLMKVV